MFINDYRPTMTDLHTKSHLCWNCQKLAIYKCPRCAVQTCSVQCVKHHKETLKCDGIRCKTTYIAKENFIESNMLSDYRFLEDVDRHACCYNRNRASGFEAKGMKMKRSKAASMKIRLKILPSAFSKHKENTTYYCFRQKRFLWHVQWIFATCKITISEMRLSDGVPLDQAVLKHIDVTQNSDAFDSRLMSYTDKDLMFYMKKEEAPANKCIYFKLNGKLGLRENLCEKTVVEFPQIYVVQSEVAHQFEDTHSILK